MFAERARSNGAHPMRAGGIASSLGIGVAIFTLRADSAIIATSDYLSQVDSYMDNTLANY